MNKYLLITLLAGTALAANSATPELRLGKRGADPVKRNHPETVRKQSVARTQAAAFAKQAAGPAKIVTAVGDNISDIEKYGTLELLMSEDFSKLDNLGKEDAPDFKTKLWLSDVEYPWWNFNPIYTNLPNWGTGGAYPAGGCLYFHCENDQAHVNTNLIDCTKGEGNIAVLEFRARAFNEGTTYDYLQVEAAETHNMGPSWDIFEEPVMFDKIPDQWTTIRVLFRNCGPTSIFNIVGVGPGYVLVDDVKVYQLHPTLAMPVVKPHTEYKGTSFVANWKPVEGVDHYILNVFSYDDSTLSNDYLVKDQEVPGDATSFEVTGAVSAAKYWYNVTAVGKDGSISLPSFDQMVFDLEVPVMNDPVIIDDYTHKASWSYVPAGDVYNYLAYDKRVAAETGKFVVTNEDFNDILDLDGYPTGLTKEDPGEESYSQYYSEQLRQQGWCAYNSCPYDGYLAIDSWWFEIGGETASLESPELDFSKDGGKFTLAVDMAGSKGEWWDTDGNIVEIMTNACVALFNWNEELGDFEQVEMFDTRKMTPAMTTDFQTYEFNFSKGSERSKVAIFAVGGVDNLYVDNLVITQNYQKDETLMEPFLYKRFHGKNEGDDPTVLEVTVPWYASGYEVLHQVSAFSRQLDKYQQGYEDRESAYSPLTYVRTTERSGVTEVSGDQSNVTRVGANIAISNPAGEAVRVVTLGGQTLLSTAAEQATVALPAHGLYLVRIGQKTYKVMY